MKAVLTAILLDYPVELEPDTKLMATVLPESENEERSEWARFSLENLARAYEDCEPEYPLNLIREPNPEYKGSRRQRSAKLLHRKP
jgi:hypothetical protein